MSCKSLPEGMTKVKLAHVFEDGSKVEFETYVEASGYDAAVAAAETQFAAAVKVVADGAVPAMRKVKVEA